MSDQRRRFAQLNVYVVDGDAPPRLLFTFGFGGALTFRDIPTCEYTGKPLVAGAFMRIPQIVAQIRDLLGVSVCVDSGREAESCPPMLYVHGVFPGWEPSRAIDGGVVVSDSYARLTAILKNKEVAMGEVLPGQQFGFAECVRVKVV